MCMKGWGCASDAIRNLLPEFHTHSSYWWKVLYQFEDIRVEVLYIFMLSIKVQHFGKPPERLVVIWCGKCGLYLWRKDIVSKNRTASQPIRFIGTQRCYPRWASTTFCQQVDSSLLLPMLHSWWLHTLFCKLLQGAVSNYMSDSMLALGVGNDRDESTCWQKVVVAGHGWCHWVLMNLIGWDAVLFFDTMFFLHK